MKSSQLIISDYETDPIFAPVTLHVRNTYPEEFVIDVEQKIEFQHCANGRLNCHVTKAPSHMDENVNDIFIYDRRSGNSEI